MMNIPIIYAYLLVLEDVIEELRDSEDSTDRAFCQVLMTVSGAVGRNQILELRDHLKPFVEEKAREEGLI